VSFDDGDHWQSLRLNMPATSIRDRIVKDDDLIVATHGRGFWILDDITPLRQIDALRAADVVLFKPAIAYRVRWNTNTDTPIPPDEATAPNPPEGAIVDYALKADATGPVTLDVLDAGGRLVRHYSSADKPDAPDPATAPVPLYWYRPPHTLATTAGMHRFTWDLHYQPVPGVAAGRGGLPIAAVPHNTVVPNAAPWVPAGQYTVKLTVNGRSYTQPLTVKMDPRVKTPAPALAQQFTLSKALYDGQLQTREALQQLRDLRAQVKDRLARAGSAADALNEFDAKAAALEGQPPAAGPGGGRGGAPNGPDTLSNMPASLGQLLAILQEADVAPTTQLVAAVGDRRAALAKLMARWTTLKGADLTALNAKLKAANVPPIAAGARPVSQ